MNAPLKPGMRLYDRTNAPLFATVLAAVAK
jgi:hypothetical protein